MNFHSSRVIQFRDSNKIIGFSLPGETIWYRYEEKKRKMEPCFLLAGRGGTLPRFVGLPGWLRGCAEPQPSRPRCQARLYASVRGISTSAESPPGRATSQPACARGHRSPAAIGGMPRSTQGHQQPLVGQPEAPEATSRHRWDAQKHPRSPADIGGTARST